MKPDKQIPENLRKTIDEIKLVVHASRKAVAKTVNFQLLQTYWQIGKIISERENNDTTARSFILELSKILTRELGKGFSRSNLFNMRNFYLKNNDVQTVSGHLSWSHYCELLAIEEDSKRGFYEREAINSNWSVRELKRQLESALFERLILAKGKNR